MFLYLPVVLGLLKCLTSSDVLRLLKSGMGTGKEKKNPEVKI